MATVITDLTSIPSRCRCLCATWTAGESGLQLRWLTLSHADTAACKAWRAVLLAHPAAVLFESIAERMSPSPATDGLPAAA